METMYHENFNNQLRRLLGGNINSVKTLHEAIEHADSEEIKTKLTEYSQQRHSFVSELETEIRRSGGNIADANDASENSSSHFSWIDIKTALTSKDDQAVLETCRNSEKSLLDLYDDILQGSILENRHLKLFIMEQRFKINESFMELDRIYFGLFKTNPSL